MVTDFIMNVLADFFVWFIDFVDSQLPASVETGTESIGAGASAFAYVVHQVQSVGVWIPIEFGFSMVVLVWAVKFFGLTVRIIRVILSVFTGGGGA